MYRKIANLESASKQETSWDVSTRHKLSKTKTKKGCNKSSKCRAPRDVKFALEHISTPSKHQSRSSSEANDAMRSFCTKYKLNSCFVHCLRENTGGNSNSTEKETVNNSNKVIKSNKVII